MDDTYKLQRLLVVIGAHFHGEVLDHRTMDVIKQTVNALAYTDTRSGQPTTCFTLYGQVSLDVIQATQIKHPNISMY